MDIAFDWSLTSAFLADVCLWSEIAKKSIFTLWYTLLFLLKYAWSFDKYDWSNENSIHLKQLLMRVVSWFLLQIVQQLFSGYCEAVLYEWASSLDGTWSSKNVLVRLSWPLLLMCGSYVEELQRKTTIIMQWFRYLPMVCLVHLVVFVTKTMVCLVHSVVCVTKTI